MFRSGLTGRGPAQEIPSPPVLRKEMYCKFHIIKFDLIFDHIWSVGGHLFWDEENANRAGPNPAHIT